jgi:hypothetical protein
MTNVLMYVNTDTLDVPYGDTGAEYVEVDFDNDFLVFSAGSDTVKDGEPIPGSNDLSQAGVVITTSEQIVPYYFLADISANELKEIKNAGNQNKRYVLAFSFDGPTTSEPVLEVWDDQYLNSVDFACLGAGDADNSWVLGIATTSGLPGADWANGTNKTLLAGASDGHFLWLNNLAGALSSATILYCQLAIKVPASYENPGAETPVFVIKYTTS